MLYYRYLSTGGMFMKHWYNKKEIILRECTFLEEKTIGENLYHQPDGTTEVWEKFRNGVQWGQ